MRIDLHAHSSVSDGTEDPATTVEMVQEIADGIPGARFVTVPGAGHLPNATHPDEVNAALRQHFL